VDEIETVVSLSLTFASETSRVPLALDRVAEFARRIDCGNLDALLLVVRELLMNAIVHGNGEDPDRAVRLRVEAQDGLLEVQVEDEGSGFDHESLQLSLPEDPQHLGRRGLVLVHELCDELEFGRGGSRVRATVYSGGDAPNPDREAIGIAAGMDNREETCTSPMARSL
jgi:anti-sigma regulatory factor (Ser/Thr protein kinase)